MSELPPSDDLLARFLAGELPAGEHARVERWVADSPSHAVELERVRALWRSVAPESTRNARWNVDAAWTRVEGQLSEDAAPAAAKPQLVESSAKARSSTTKRSVAPRRAGAAARAWYQHPALRAAAAIVMMAGIGYLWRVQLNTAIVREARYATGIGRLRMIALPDSTVVALGPSSSMRMLSGYGRRERVVELSGEAWFRVRHDATRPFTVRTSRTITQDIGTEFTVRALPDDSTVRVIVHEGAATLRHVDASADRAVLLRAHDVGIVVGARDALRAEPDSSPTPTWRNGALTFDAAPLHDVVTELQRWYPVVFAPLEPPLDERRVSATLPAKDLQESLTILRLALGLSFEQRGDTVVVR